MLLRDLPAWPPIWTRQDAEMDKTAIDSYLRGEVGLLRDAFSDLGASAIVLTIDHNEQTWVGMVPFAGAAKQLSAIADFLRGQPGQPIRHLATLPLPD